MHICSLKKGCDLFLNLIKDIDTRHDHQKSIVAEVFGDCVSESIHFLGANVQSCIAPGYVGHPFHHGVPISV